MILSFVAKKTPFFPPNIINVILRHEREFSQLSMGVGTLSGTYVIRYVIVLVSQCIGSIF